MSAPPSGSLTTRVPWWTEYRPVSNEARLGGADGVGHEERLNDTPLGDQAATAPIGMRSMPSKRVSSRSMTTKFGRGVSVGVLPDVSVGVADAVALSDGVAVALGEIVAVGVSDGMALAVCVAVATGVAVPVAPALNVAVADEVAVALGGGGQPRRAALTPAIRLGDIDVTVVHPRSAAVHCASALRSKATRTAVMSSSIATRPSPWQSHGRQRPALALQPASPAAPGARPPRRPRRGGSSAAALACQKKDIRARLRCPRTIHRVPRQPLSSNSNQSAKALNRPLPPPPRPNWASPGCASLASRRKRGI